MEVKGRGQAQLVTLFEGISAEQVLVNTSLNTVCLDYVAYTIYTWIKGVINYLGPYLAHNYSPVCSLKEQEEVVKERNPSRSSR